MSSTNDIGTFNVEDTGNVVALSVEALPVTMNPGGWAAVHPAAARAAAPQKLSALPKNGSWNAPTVSMPLIVSEVVVSEMLPVLTLLGPTMLTVKEPLGAIGTAQAGRTPIMTTI